MAYQIVTPENTTNNKDDIHFEIKETKIIQDINGNDIEIFDKSETVSKNELNQRILKHESNIEYHNIEINKLKEKIALIDKELA